MNTTPARDTDRAKPKLSPRARARLFWLRIHRWLGVGLMLVFLAIGLTGMGLVWRDTTEALVHPDRVPAATRDARAAPPALGAIVAAGAAALPAGSLPVQIMPVGRTGAAMLTGESSGPPIWGIGPPKRPRVWIDPADARVLGVSRGGPDAIFVLKAVHGHLLVGSFGRWLMAAAGLSLVLSAGTGIYLWWPGRRNILKSLKWRRQFTRSMNIHRIVGPLAALGLLAQGTTGVFMALPWLFALFADAPAEPPSPPPSRPIARPSQPIDAVVARAATGAGGAPLVSIQFPKERDANWRLAYAGGLSVAVGDADGAITVKPAPPVIPSERWQGVIIDLHEGGFGPIHRILLFATGMALSLFSITGILLWAQGRKRKTPR